MKKLLLAVVLMAGHAYGQNTYNGNGKTGFGGTIGNGSLTITESGTDIVLTLSTAATFNDKMVIYFDSKTGGFSNTNNMTDEADQGRGSISGNWVGNASEVSFPSGFGADYALVWDAGGSGLFELAEGGNNSLIFISYVGANLTRTIPKSALGITGPASFKFVATYISGTAYRSNEALVQNIGDGGEGGGNFGYNPISFSASNDFPLTPLNVTLKTFLARRQGAAISLQWRASCTGSYANFELQRSTDGKNFSKVYSEKATAARCNDPFFYTDATASSGKTYYRLKLTSDAGRVTYSSIALLQPLGSTAGSSMSLVPTVVSNNALLQINSSQKGTALIRIVTAGGQMIQAQQLTLQDGSQSLPIAVDRLPAGMYIISMQQNNLSTQQI